MLDQLTDLQRKVWDIITSSIMFSIFTHFFYLKFLFVQEHLLNDANKTLRQRVCSITDSFHDKL